MKVKTTDLIHGSVGKSIFYFSIPLLIGNLFQQLYNTVDSYVVGNYVGKQALAAVGAASPVINMLIGFFMGIVFELPLLCWMLSGIGLLTRSFFISLQTVFCGL